MMQVDDGAVPMHEDGGNSTLALTKNGDDSHQRMMGDYIVGPKLGEGGFSLFVAMASRVSPLQCWPSRLPFMRSACSRRGRARAANRRVGAAHARMRLRRRCACRRVRQALSVRIACLRA